MSHEPKTSVLNSLSVYAFDFFTYSDISKFTTFRNYLVYRNLRYGNTINFALSRYEDWFFNSSK